MAGIAGKNNLAEFNKKGSVPVELLLHQINEMSIRKSDKTG
jgi:hypothetical protein